MYKAWVDYRNQQRDRQQLKRGGERKPDKEYIRGDASENGAMEDIREVM